MTYFNEKNKMFNAVYTYYLRPRFYLTFKLRSDKKSLKIGHSPTDACEKIE